MTYFNGNSFKGLFSGNRRRGLGKFEYRDGRKFEGMYKLDKRDGVGTLFFRNGGSLDGVWKHGILVKKIKK